MKPWLVLPCLITALLFGFKTGQKTHTIRPATQTTQDIDLPVKSRKTFVFVVYGYNQELWAKRALRSIFEQEYDYYRIVFIDDGSKDNTFQIARDFISENNQESKTLLIRNEESLGYLACLYQAVQGALDQEIVIPLHAKDWLSHSGALTRINAVFQNPDIWIASTSGLQYPSYEIVSQGFEGFYAALFKQIPSKEFLGQGKSTQKTALPLKQIADNRTRHIHEPLIFNNTTIVD